MKAIISGALGFLLLAAVPAQARILGYTQLNDRQDYDVIHLGTCPRPNVPISKVRFEVRREPAQIDRVMVRFANGGEQELVVRRHFAAGSGSRWISLRGDGKRCVTSIRVLGDADTYRRTPYRKSVLVFHGY